MRTGEVLRLGPQPHDTSATQARDEGAMGDPHLIGPVPRTTSAKTSGGRSPRALPDDLLRDASRRLGILSLVAAGLWIVATILGHLAVRSMSHGDPQWLRVGMPEAIAALSAVLSVSLFFYTRRSQRDPRTLLDLGQVYLVLTALALGLVFHWEPMPRPRANRAPDLVDRRRRADVCRHRAEHAGKDACLRPDFGLDEPGGDACRPCPWHLALRVTD